MTLWKVVYSRQAVIDLRDIRTYISDQLQEPETAKSQVKRILETVLKLNYMPMRHRLYEKRPWCDIGYRMLPVDNYIVFYLPNEERKTVSIIRIVYGKRNLDEQLLQTGLEN